APPPRGPGARVGRVDLRGRLGGIASWGPPPRTVCRPLCRRALPARADSEVAPEPHGNRPEPVAASGPDPRDAGRDEPRERDGRAHRRGRPGQPAGAVAAPACRWSRAPGPSRPAAVTAGAAEGNGPLGHRAVTAGQTGTEGAGSLPRRLGRLGSGRGRRAAGDR